MLDNGGTVPEGGEAEAEEQEQEAAAAGGPEDLMIAAVAVKIVEQVMGSGGPSSPHGPCWSVGHRR